MLQRNTKSGHKKRADAPKKLSLAQRRRARRLVLQALYQWLMTKNPPKEIALQFHEQNTGKIDWEYFNGLARLRQS